MGGGGGSKKQTIGYKYYLGMHMGICLAPINSITALYVGERLAWVGDASYSPGLSKTSISVSKLNLFGGQKKEGGVQGIVDVIWGDPDGEVNDYLESKLETLTLPAFRGVVSLVLRQCYVCAGAPYPKPWWALVTHIPGSIFLSDPWNPALSQPTAGSANPAHIIRETFINTDWGLGYPPTQLDDTAFTSVANTLYSEQFGLSYILSSQGPVEEFIQEILKTINGVIYTDRETGKFVLKLIREDYDIEDLLVFDDSNILEYSSFQRPQPAEMINEVTIVYKRKFDINETSVTFQDLSSIVTQGAIISQKLEYLGIDDDNIASLVGMRELRQYSTQLGQAVFIANRQAWNLNPGDPFVYSWEERGIVQLVMRATKINYGELKDGRIEVTAVEDIFGLPAATYVEPQGSLWEEPVVDPTALPLDDIYAFEAPYYVLVLNVEAPTIEILTESSSLLITLASYPQFPSASFELWTTIDQTAPYENFTLKVNGIYCYRLLIAQDLVETDNEVPISVSLFPENFIEDTPLGSLCIIGEGANAEIAILSAYDETLNTITLKRGALDTLPKIHSIGDYVWFFDDNWALDTTEYVEGTQVAIKLLPETGQGTLDIDDANVSTLEMVGRQYRPSPPSYIRIFDLGTGYRFFPPTIRGQFNITWRRTNRLTQTIEGSAPYFFSLDDVSAEGNVVWNLVVYGEDLATIILDLDLPSTATTYTWITEEIDSGLSDRLNNALKVILRAIRTEGAVEIESYEEFDEIIERRGWTYNWDKYFNGDED